MRRLRGVLAWTWWWARPVRSRQQLWNAVAAAAGGAPSCPGGARRYSPRAAHHRWITPPLMLWSHNHDLPSAQQLSPSQLVTGMCRISHRDRRVLGEVLATYDGPFDALDAHAVEAGLTHPCCSAGQAVTFVARARQRGREEGGSGAWKAVGEVVAASRHPSAAGAFVVLSTHPHTSEITLRALCEELGGLDSAAREVLAALCAEDASAYGQLSGTQLAERCELALAATCL